MSEGLVGHSNLARSSTSGPVLPLLTQYLSSPEVGRQLDCQNKQVDWLEVVRLWADLNRTIDAEKIIVPRNTK